MNGKLLLTLFTLLLILNACTTKWTTSNQELGSVPPQPKLIADGNSITVYQSSYCWNTMRENTCVDYISPDKMLKDKNKDKVTTNTPIRIQLEGKQPTEVVLSRFYNDNITQETITENGFEAPRNKGIYYYSLSANWIKDKEKRISEGSSSYAFAIEVTD
ncbi:hypothetical protein [Paenibacillus alvei]|uniref:hypothetical protein n=1 Tax=Paenibacillus alvei TaxID=44250 RepID=UPI00228307B0|nr:hypothetical protein [Paenibacillus alvei]